MGQPISPIALLQKLKMEYMYKHAELGGDNFTSNKAL